MGFWSHAFERLGDNLRTLNAAAGDVQDNLNPFSDEFLSGDAHQTAAEVERQLAEEQGRDVSQARIDASAEGGLSLVGDAAKKTGADVAKAAGDVADKAGAAVGGALDLLTSPWFIGAAVVVVVLVIAAPYVAPVVGKALA